MDHKFITKMDKNSDWADTRENRKIINQMANDKNYLWAETVTERKLQKHWKKQTWKPDQCKQRHSIG